ncbi:hypothetical protein NG99_21040 [Erwinia typographi]|uniref:Uncharacterized protein n=2 Tax=Erwinia typographi TaxID=371042 RepID=A0A0A3YPL7_9GAMM|nr:hypothetical protein NG99_21040 [Erwinia typographi]
MVRPGDAQGEVKPRLSNVKVNRNRTTSENPRTVRMTPAEKVMCSGLADDIQALTTKTITGSTVLRAALYLARESGPEKMLEMIKEYL